MKSPLSWFYRVVTGFVLLMLAPMLFAQARPGAGTFGGPPVDGTISAVNSTEITVMLVDGSNRTIAISDRTRIVVSEMVALSNIRAGDFVGVAASKGPDGSLVAVAINIFPSQTAGNARAGQFPMPDGNIMTNAPVTNVVTSVGNQTLTLTYSGGVAVVAVPSTANIHRLSVAAADALSVGETVSIRETASANGPEAVAITVIRS